MRAFRLLGSVEGKPVAYSLLDGVLSVGSLEASDIFLPVEAVSRRHAALEIKQGRVYLRDLGSKNGTWVNGNRVSEVTLNVGDEIGFGPAIFRLVEVDQEDVALAIRLERRSTTSPTRDSEVETGTQARRSVDQPPTWITLLNEIATLLFGHGQPRLASVVGRLKETLGAEGVLLAEMQGTDTLVVLAAAGGNVPDVQRTELHGALERAVQRSHKHQVVCFGLDRPQRLIVCVGALAPGAVMLVATGDVRHREAAQVLLQVVLRMVLASQGRTTPRLQTVEEGRPELAALVFPAGYLAGISAAMQTVYDQLRQVAPGDIPVLIMGETGTGKEFIARTLHLSSSRRDGPFLAVNCAAIPPELLEAELFGIERGVATGVGERPGKFQLANGGTLFLDEISDMSQGLQAKLLRVLQEMEVHPLGADYPVPVDVRVLSATNTDIRRQILERKFRRDLYFRVAGFTLRVPPLRERRDDIPVLVEHFLRRFSDEIGKPIRGVTLKALRLLVEAPWPGNVRELEHAVRRLVYMCPPEQAIDSSMLSDSVLSPTLGQDAAALDPALDLRIERHTADLERRLITLALARTKGNISRAAKLLGLSRNGLKRRMGRYGIE